MSATIPTDEFLQVVEPLMIAADLDTSSLARRCEVEIDSLFQAFGRPNINFDLADLILCKLGVPHYWWSEFENIYWGLELRERPFRFKRPDGRLRCDRGGCRALFLPSTRNPRQRFCSRLCFDLDWKRRNGHVRRPSVGIAYVCKNGHERTPENTARGARGEQVCIICRRASNRLSKERARQRAVAA